MKSPAIPGPCAFLAECAQNKKLVWMKLPFFHFKPDACNGTKRHLVFVPNICPCSRLIVKVFPISFPRQREYGPTRTPDRATGGSH